MKAYLLSLILIFVLLDTTVPTTSSLLDIFKPLEKPLQKIIPNLKKQSKSLFKEGGLIDKHYSNNKKTKFKRRGSNYTELYDNYLKAKSMLEKGREERSIDFETIDGLNNLKEYLSIYGYMKHSNSFNNVLDDRTVSSIKTYQKFFNLKMTGELDKETVQQMALLRCGVPDLNYTFHLTGTDHVSWPLGTGWFPNHRRELTYGFLPASKIPPKAIKVFRDSFKRWSVAVDGAVNFTETTTYNAADIKIGFFHFSRHTFRMEVVGATVMIKQSDYHKVFNGRGGDGGDGLAYGIVALDSSKYWALPGDNLAGKQLWKFGVVDLETVAMHQIGHLLGLRHSSDEESVMYPSILPDRQRKVNLSKDDKEQIHKIYFSGKP